MGEYNMDADYRRACEQRDLDEDSEAFIATLKRLQQEAENSCAEAWGLFIKGRIALEEHEPELADEMFLECIQRLSTSDDPENAPLLAEAFYNRAETRNRLGGYEEYASMVASLAANALFRTDPRCAELLVRAQLQFVYHTLGYGREEDAFKALDAAAEAVNVLDEEVQDRFNARVALGKAHALGVFNRDSEALATLSTALPTLLGSPFREDIDAGIEGLALKAHALETADAEAALNASRQTLAICAEKGESNVWAMTWMTALGAHIELCRRLRRDEEILETGKTLLSRGRNMKRGQLAAAFFFTMATWELLKAAQRRGREHEFRDTVFACLDRLSTIDNKDFRRLVQATTSMWAHAERPSEG